MAKHNYVARFGEFGVLTRTSQDRVYTHAWAVLLVWTQDGERKHAVASGFAGSAELAHKAINSGAYESTKVFERLAVPVSEVEDDAAFRNLKVVEKSIKDWGKSA